MTEEEIELRIKKSVILMDTFIGSELIRCIDPFNDSEIFQIVGPTNEILSFIDKEIFTELIYRKYVVSTDKEEEDNLSKKLFFCITPDGINLARSICNLERKAHVIKTNLGNISVVMSSQDFPLFGFSEGKLLTYKIEANKIIIEIAKDGHL